MVTVITSFDKPSDAQATQAVIKMLQSSFTFSLIGRLTVVSDLSQFEWRENKSVWEQGKGKRPHYFELRWDNVWICDFDMNTPAKVLELRFWQGFKYGLQNNMISLHEKTELQKIMDEQMIKDAVDSVQKDIDRLKTERPKDETDAMAKEIVVDILEKKKEEKKHGKKS